MRRGHSTIRNGQIITRCETCSQYKPSGYYQNNPDICSDCISNPPPPREYIYVLPLTGENFYIGQTNDIDRRLEEHRSGSGAGWTAKHPPVGDPISIMNSESKYHEMLVTLEYMEKYGCDRVRGGPFCKVDYAEEMLHQFQIMIWMINGCCYKCGSSNHMGTTCEQREGICGKCGQEIMLCWKNKKPYWKHSAGSKHCKETGELTTHKLAKKKIREFLKNGGELKAIGKCYQCEEEFHHILKCSDKHTVHREMTYTGESGEVIFDVAVANIPKDHLIFGIQVCLNDDHAEKLEERLEALWIEIKADDILAAFDLEEDPDKLSFSNSINDKWNLCDSCQKKPISTDLQTTVAKIQEELIKQKEEKEKMVDKKGADKPENAGKPWSEQDDAQLLEDLTKYSQKTIAEKYQRTRGAIRSRIRHIAVRMSSNGKSKEEIMKVTKLSSEELESALIRSTNRDSCKVDKYEHVNSLSAEDRKYFEKLREWRREEALLLQWQSYLIADDKSLRSIAYYKPKNEKELLKIKGFGPEKVNRYSAAILRIINDGEEVKTVIDES